MWSHKPSFTVALTVASRAVNIRDRLMRRMPLPADADEFVVTQYSIPSGKNTLDAAYVEPARGPALASVLICHGIGEIVPQWLPLQRLLAANGVASMVFDYSGYGRSNGRVTWTQCELDAVSAFQLLESLSPPRPLSILGFSLGTGIVPAVINLLNADRMVLCASFTSFRAAAHAIGLPKFLSRLIPPIWSAKEPLRNCKLPTLVVHSTADRLFPVQMARDLVSWCAGPAELLLMPGFGHNEPFYRPELTFWGPIIKFLTRTLPAPGAPEL